MREILFRGKRSANDAWVEGHVVVLPKSKRTKILVWNAADLDFDAVDVMPETVGQFTGLTDKNGKKIFEGDVFHLDDEVVAVVIFQDGCFRLEEYGLRGAFTESGFDECGGGWDVIDCSPIDWYTIKDMEIIGNIHDSPELLLHEGRIEDPLR